MSRHSKETFTYSVPWRPWHILLLAQALQPAVMLHSYVTVGGFWKNSQGIRVDLTFCIGYSLSLQRTSNIFFCPNLLSPLALEHPSLSDSSFTTVSSAWAHNHSTQPSDPSQCMWSSGRLSWDFPRTMYLDTLERVSLLWTACLSP